MGRHTDPGNLPAQLPDARTTRWPAAPARDESTVRPRITAERAAVVPTLGELAAATPRQVRDDAVAVSALPPVPLTGGRPAGTTPRLVEQPVAEPYVAAHHGASGPALQRPVAERPAMARPAAERPAMEQYVVERRPVERASHAAPRRAGARGAQPRKGGRLHGVLVYATGVVMVLSSAYGVAGTVGGGDNVLTDSASSVRSFLGGNGEKQCRWHHKGEDVAPAPAPAPAPEAAAPVTEEPVAAPAAPPAAAPTSAAPTTTAAPAPAPTSTSTAAPAATSASAVPAGTWLSGASGDGVSSGAFGTWRGTPVAIGGTWADNNEAMTELWQLDRGGEFGSWNQALDIAIGAIGEGESWEQAARGAYDQRWRESLTNLKEKWGDRTAPLFIRFAHEMNGDWYDWSVNSGNKDAFVTSWKHFRALQQEIFPASQLVFSLNRESVNSGFDWRQSFPGAQYVDVIGVDYYNQYPTVTSAAQWADSLDDVDKYGAPKGLQKHLDFARSVGLPLSVPEWSGHAGNGDSAPWIQGMHDFFAANAGGGAGQVVYDVQFNIDMHGDAYRVYPTTNMPASAEAYRRLF
ncbi:glycoside hydrolase family 26 protein [Modestobacter versicolor]|uniref:glycoside hydrolase family 26 protein n=1 Tax=Modestobacter versicolor TaxID=429133 RepID=UPI0034DFC1A0